MAKTMDHIKKKRRMNRVIAGFMLSSTALNVAMPLMGGPGLLDSGDVEASDLARAVRVKSAKIQDELLGGIYAKEDIRTTGRVTLTIDGKYVPVNTPLFIRLRYKTDHWLDGSQTGGGGDIGGPGVDAFERLERQTLKDTQGNTVGVLDENGITFNENVRNLLNPLEVNLTFKSDAVQRTYWHKLGKAAFGQPRTEDTTINYFLTFGTHEIKIANQHKLMFTYHSENNGTNRNHRWIYTSAEDGNYRIFKPRVLLNEVRRGDTVKAVYTLPKGYKFGGGNPDVSRLSKHASVNGIMDNVVRGTPAAMRTRIEDASGATVTGASFSGDRRTFTVTYKMNKDMGKLRYLDFGSYLTIEGGNKNTPVNIQHQYYRNNKPAYTLGLNRYYGEPRSTAELQLVGKPAPRVITEWRVRGSNELLNSKTGRSRFPVSDYTPSGRHRYDGASGNGQKYIYWYIKELPSVWSTRYINKKTGSAIAGHPPVYRTAYDESYADKKTISGYRFVNTETDSSKKTRTHYYEVTDTVFTTKYIDKKTGRNLLAPIERTGAPGSDNFAPARTFDGYRKVDEQVTSHGTGGKVKTYYYEQEAKYTYTTKWVDENGRTLPGKWDRTQESTNPSSTSHYYPAGEVTGYTFVRTNTSGRTRTHTFRENKSEYITRWVDRKTEQDIATFERVQSKSDNPTLGTEFKRQRNIQGYTYNPNASRRIGNTYIHYYDKDTYQFTTRWVDANGNNIAGHRPVTNENTTNRPDYEDKKVIPGYDFVRTETDTSTRTRFHRYQVSQKAYRTRYLEEGTGRTLEPDVVRNSRSGPDYASRKTIPGYSFAREDSTSQANTKIYYYKKDALTYTTRYIDEETNRDIPGHGPETRRSTDGPNYAGRKDISGYVYQNRENIDEQAREKKYFYRKQRHQFITRYVNGETGQDIPGHPPVNRENTTGNADFAGKKNIPGWDFESERVDGNTKIYHYLQQQYITRWVDEAIGRSIPGHDDVENTSPDGNPSFESKREIRGYRYSRENVSGRTKTYYYKAEQNFTTRWVDNATGQDISGYPPETRVTTGEPDFAEKKDISGWRFAREEVQGKTKIYRYDKEQTFTTRWVDDANEQDIPGHAPEERITTGEQDFANKKDIDGWRFEREEIKGKVKLYRYKKEVPFTTRWVDNATGDDLPGQQPEQRITTGEQDFADKKEFQGWRFNREEVQGNTKIYRYDKEITFTTRFVDRQTGEDIPGFDPIERITIGEPDYAERADIPEFSPDGEETTNRTRIYYYNRVVKKDVRQTRTIPYETIYRVDPTKPEDYREVVVKGVLGEDHRDGVQTTVGSTPPTTKWTTSDQTDSDGWYVVTPKVDEEIVVGKGNPHIPGEVGDEDLTNIIPYDRINTFDIDLPAVEPGEEPVWVQDQEPQEGLQNKGVTWKVRPDGSIYDIKIDEHWTTITEKKDDLWRYGPENIPFPRKSMYDPEKPFGYIEIEQPGQKGKKEPIEDRIVIPPVEELTVYGPIPLPYGTIKEFNKDLEPGSGPIEKRPGQVGKYNPVEGKVDVPPVDRIVEYGPIPVPFETFEVENPRLPKGVRVKVQTGKVGWRNPLEPDVNKGTYINPIDEIWEVGTSDQKPVIIAEDEYVRQGTKYETGRNAKALDFEDGSLTHDLITDYSLVNTDRVGRYTVHHVVRDSHGNETTKETFVYVLPKWQERLDSLNEGSDALDKRLEGVGTENEAIAKEIETLRQKLTDDFKVVEDALAEMSGVYDILERDIADTEQASADRAKEIERIKGLQTTINETLDRIDQTLRTLEERVSTNESNIAGLNDGIAAWRQKAEGLREDMKSLDGHLESMAKRLMTAESLTGRLEDLAKANGDALKETAKRLDQLTLDGSAIETGIEDLDKELTTWVAHINGEIAKQQTKVDALSKDIQATLEAARSNRGDIEALEALIQGLFDKFNALNSEIADLSGQMDAMKAALVSQQALNETFDQSLEKAKERLNASQADIEEILKGFEAFEKDFTLVRSELEEKGNVKLLVYVNRLTGEKHEIEIHVDKDGRYTATSRLIQAATKTTPEAPSDKQQLSQEKADELKAKQEAQADKLEKEKDKRQEEAKDAELPKEEREALEKTRDEALKKAKEEGTLPKGSLTDDEGRLVDPSKDEKAYGKTSEADKNGETSDKVKDVEKDTETSEKAPEVNKGDETSDKVKDADKDKEASDKVENTDKKKDSPDKAQDTDKGGKTSDGVNDTDKDTEASEKTSESSEGYKTSDQVKDTGKDEESSEKASEADKSEETSDKDKDTNTDKETSDKAPGADKGEDKTVESKQSYENVQMEDEFGNKLDPQTGYVIDEKTGDVLKPKEGQHVNPETGEIKDNQPVDPIPTEDEPQREGFFDGLTQRFNGFFGGESSDVKEVETEEKGFFGRLIDQFSGLFGSSDETSDDIYDEQLASDNVPEADLSPVERVEDETPVDTSEPINEQIGVVEDLDLSGFSSVPQSLRDFEESDRLIKAVENAPNEEAAQKAMEELNEAREYREEYGSVAIVEVVEGEVDPEKALSDEELIELIDLVDASTTQTDQSTDDESSNEESSDLELSNDKSDDTEEDSVSDDTEEKPIKQLTDQQELLKDPIVPGGDSEASKELTETIKEVKDAYQAGVEANETNSLSLVETPPASTSKETAIPDSQTKFSNTSGSVLGLASIAALGGLIGSAVWFKRKKDE